MLERLRPAHARARERAWERGAKPERLVFYLDATADHQPPPTRSARRGDYKGGFDFHSMLCHLNESEEGLAGILRPGTAGANTAVDQVDCCIHGRSERPPAYRREVSGPPRRLVGAQGPCRTSGSCGP